MEVQDKKKFAAEEANAVAGKVCPFGVVFWPFEGISLTLLVRRMSQRCLNAAPTRQSGNQWVGRVFNLWIPFTPPPTA
jgi:hypothetical protein